LSWILWVIDQGTPDRKGSLGGSLQLEKSAD
jgi:hypothetical protein